MDLTNTRQFLRMSLTSGVSSRRRHSVVARLLWSANGHRWVLWDIYISWLAAWSAFNLTPYGRQPNGLFIGSFFGLIMGLTCWACGMPRPESNPSRYELISVGLISVTLGMVLCVVAGMGLAYVRIGRWIWLLFTGLSLAGIIAPRLMITSLESEARHSVLIFGAGRAGRAVLQQLRRHPGIKILGYIDDNRALWNTNIDGLPCLGGTAQLPFICRKTQAQMLALAITAPLPEDTALRLLKLRHIGLEILCIPELFERFAACVPVNLVSVEWLLSGGRVASPSLNRMVKRIIDVGCCLPALALTLPLWVLIAATIKLDDHGPVFFTQWRMGRGNRPFRIIKFRSMCSDAEPDGARFADDGDRRVTRVGRWLRISRLDELPQLINVLRGEMSLVGPRPERPEFIAEIEKAVPYYDQRCLILPGLTGWAQVKYRYGANVEDARRKLEFDLYYIRNMSLRLDLQILLRTLILLMKGSR